MASKKRKTGAKRKRSKKDDSWHEQRVDIREHRDKLRELSGPRAGTMGWMLALIVMALFLALLNNPF